MQTPPKAFPATCRISQPSLWRPDSWQPGWGSESCRTPTPIDQRERPSVRVAPALRAAAWSGGWGKLDLSLPPSSTSTSPSLETETRAQETAGHVRQNRGSQDGSDPHARVLAALHGLLPLQPRHRPPARQPPLTRHHSRNAPRPSLLVRPHLHLQAHSPQSPASLSTDSSNTLFTARWPP